ncbi:MAG: bifunctional 3,4-dihydroxy-2-butanone-4-phosphate synthase/GTP cyclohydrolase II [Dehalococcoidia bacterium]|nr:bifunctional 3,4-dihydroxy-2-butanone-4-phosphate synthase/GTP cyclohydrolase II [Dehalococcoidia bacterium]
MLSSCSARCGGKGEAGVSRTNHGLATIEEAIADYQAGRLVIIVDDEDRENEGDLTIPAQFVTAEHINFMTRYGRGLVCIPMTGARLDELKIPMMVSRSELHFGTPFTVSVEAAAGISTGVSAADRAYTCRVLIDPSTCPEDLIMPGHMFPLRARDGGVLVRAGQTEASVDLCKLAGIYPAAVLCEVMRPNGEMARLPHLRTLARRHGIKIVSVADLIAYRHRQEKLVERVTETVIPTRYGEFLAVAYKSMTDPDEHLALVRGDISGDEPVLVRVHSQCVTGDVFHSYRCDCGEQVELALQRIAEADRGVFVYMRQEGRGIGLHNKLRAYALQDTGLDTVEANEALGFPADRRDYGIGMQILADLGVQRIRLLTNNPAKRAGLSGFGLDVVERIPLQTVPNQHNVRYLDTKRTKLGHLLKSSPPPGGARRPKPGAPAPTGDVVG